MLRNAAGELRAEQTIKNKRGWVGLTYPETRTVIDEDMRVGLAHL